MPGDERVRLVLLVGLDGEGRPVGLLKPEADPAVGFTGWVSLMAEISRCLGNLPAPGPRAGEEAQPTS